MAGRTATDLPVPMLFCVGAGHGWRPTTMAEFLLSEAGVAEGRALVATGNGTSAGGGASGIAARARVALQRSKIYTLRKLHVEEADGAIILRGRVESFYHKQLAQELIRTAIEGVEVINGLQVVYNR